LHICLISVEIFAWGKYGGFGKATRTIGRELVKRGIQVSAIIPRRGTQQAIEDLDGIKVYGFDYRKPLEAIRIFQEVDADIYHSEEPSLGTYIAQKTHPEKKHIVTFRDTHFFSDWLTEFNYPSVNKIQVIKNWVYEDNFLVHIAIRNAVRRYAAANLLIEKAAKKYHLKNLPEFLPTPAEIPNNIHKSPIPTVCFVSRWDRRKRPEILIELIKSYPDVRFIAAGFSRDPKYDRRIRDQLASLPNVEVYGFINQFESNKLSEILSQSWILLNTAAREGLPNAFIEACAHRCAILSSLDPDEFASRFGYYAKSDDFKAGLNFLLREYNWFEKGNSGYEFVEKVYSRSSAIDKHINMYTEILNNGKIKEN
jgi:glycosyltransferase involved in cell wall biosynthesis